MELIRTSHFRSMYLGWTRAMSVNICVGAAGLGSGVAVFIFFNLIFFFNSLSLTARKGVEWNNKKTSIFG